MDARRPERRGLELLGELERAGGGSARALLDLRRRRRAQEERPAEAMVEALVRLDDVADSAAVTRSPARSQNSMNCRFFTTAMASRVNWPAATRSTVPVSESRYANSGP